MFDVKLRCNKLERKMGASATSIYSYRAPAVPVVETEVGSVEPQSWLEAPPSSIQRALLSTSTHAHTLRLTACGLGRGLWLLGQ